MGSLFPNPPPPPPTFNLTAKTRPPDLYPDSSTDTKEQHVTVIGMAAADLSSDGDRPPEEGEGLSVDDHGRNCTKEQHVTVIGMAAADLSSYGDRPPEEGEGEGLAVDDHGRNSNSSGYINNPLVQRQHEMGKILLSLVVPLTTGVLTVYAIDPPSLPAFHVISLSLCLGLSAVWNGILLRDLLPRAANVIQQLGTASIFFAFCYVVGSLLPPNMVCLIWTCFLVILLPSLFSCVPM